MYSFFILYVNVLSTYVCALYECLVPIQARRECLDLLELEGATIWC